MGRVPPDNLSNSSLRELILNDSDGAVEHPPTIRQKGGGRSYVHVADILEI